VYREYYFGTILANQIVNVESVGGGILTPSGIDIEAHVHVNRCHGCNGVVVDTRGRLRSRAMAILDHPHLAQVNMLLKMLPEMLAVCTLLIGGNKTQKIRRS
jgi:hypothetical protein